jgi:hypothetical protein
LTQYEKIERLYNVKLERYIKNGIEISDELNDVLYEEAIQETLAKCYINEKGRINGNKVRRQKDT